MMVSGEIEDNSVEISVKVDARFKLIIYRKSIGWLPIRKRETKIIYNYNYCHLQHINKRIKLK